MKRGTDVLWKQSPRGGTLHTRYTTLSSGVPWIIPRVTCICSVYKAGQVGYSMVYHKKVLHNYFMPCLLFEIRAGKRYATHDGKIELNTVEYTTAFLNSDWLNFLWHGLKIFIREDSAPRYNPLPICIPFSQNSYPFRIPFIEKRFSYTYLRTLFSFLNPWNEVNKQYYETASSITRRDVNQKYNYYSFSSDCERNQERGFQYAFIYFDLWIPYLFLPEAWKRCPVRTRLPPPSPGCKIDVHYEKQIFHIALVALKRYYIAILTVLAQTLDIFFTSCLIKLNFVNLY